MNGYNSQYGEDAWIAANLPLPDKGVYVDAGCGHPVQFSETAFLRARGWSGVAIDANPAYGPEWEQLAPGHRLVTAVLSKRKRVRFEMHENSMTSRIGPAGVMVEAHPLEYVLGGCEIWGKIDFLSMDLEGAEFEVFATLELEKHWPTIIVAEYNTSGIGEDFRLRDYLVKRGRYKVVHQTEANLVYYLQE